MYWIRSITCLELILTICVTARLAMDLPILALVFALWRGETWGGAYKILDRELRDTILLSHNCYSGELLWVLVIGLRFHCCCHSVNA